MRFDTVTNGFSSEWVVNRAIRNSSVGAHLHFNMATADEVEEMPSETGFRDISNHDRNAWFSELFREELELVQGPLYRELIDTVGKDSVDRRISVRKNIARSALSGGPRPTHNRANRPGC